MNNSASIKTLIREMDSTELERHLYDKWKSIGKSISILNYQYLGYIATCYKQLTGDNILYNISPEFTEMLKPVLKNK